MNTFMLLLPETLLLVFAFLVFSLDMIWKNREGNQANTLAVIALIGALSAFVATIFVWAQANSGAVQLAVIATDANGQVPMLAMDSFAMFFKLYATLTVALVGLLATDYVRQKIQFPGEFYALMLLAGLSLMLVASSTNLVMIFLAFEFLSITSYLLTGYMRDNDFSVEAALKYFLYGSVASAVMLFGFSLIYGATGSLDLRGIAEALVIADPTITHVLVIPALTLIVVGLGFKIALVPFHQWSPEAYQGAPTPVTAFLSVGPKASGFALMVRVLTVAFPAFATVASTNWILLLTGISILTMTFGNVVAMWQKDIKRLFAYSSIAQVGYMLIGVIAIAPQYIGGTGMVDGWAQGLNGLLLFLFGYLFTNLGSFAIILAVENKTGATDLDAYNGLIKRSPYLAIAFVIFLLSLIGIPPTAGFMGKLLVFGAAVEQQMYLLAAIGVFNSVISLYYYFGIARKMFFSPAPDNTRIAVSGSLNTVVTVSLVLVLAIAIFAQPFINLVNSSTQILASTF